MKLLYKGLMTSNGRTRRTGCASCGGSRPIARSSIQFADEYNFVFEGRQFRFKAGQSYNVPDELGRLLLQKYSYNNGLKMYAFEVASEDSDNPQSV